MRRKFDFYPTPPDCIEALLDRETFEGQVWEPACGDGRIVSACHRRGLSAFGTDIRTGDDFLQMSKRTDCIVTNPPYSIATEFAVHALRLARLKVAMLLRLEFLSGIERCEQLWRFHSLKSLLVFAKRVQFGSSGCPQDSHAWFVWEKGHRGPTDIQFIYNVSVEDQWKRLQPFFRRFSK